MKFPVIPIWKEAPFIRLLIPLMLGIATAGSLHLPSWLSAILIASIFITVVLLNRRSSFSRFKIRIYTGTLVYSSMFILGTLLHQLNDIRNRSDWIGHTKNQAEAILAKIEEPPIEKRKTYKTTASIQYRFLAGKWMMASGKLFIYIPKDEIAKTIGYGSMLAFSSSIEEIRNTGNPGSFDYRAYCALQNIYHQSFLRKDKFRILAQKQSNRFTKVLFGIQNKIVAILERYVGGREAGLAEALLIGYKNNLDKSIIQEYSDSGIIHIVAISGMHLGLIYWLLSLLLSIKRWKKSRWINPLIILASLWLFTLVAGASASVVRSAVMFSFLLVGESINRKTSMYNSLAASAFLLLCYNPSWLWDLGFQLSYLAVLSIVIFMKPVYNLIYASNKILDYLWKMAATCIAAQILTTPLTLFYFQRFPVYFLITNIVAVPISSLVVLGEVALCAISALPFVPELLGRIINWLIKIMNRFVGFMNEMPFGSLTQVYQDHITLILLYIMIILLCLWIRIRYALLLVLFLLTLNVYLFVQYLSISSVLNQHLLIVYNAPGLQYVELINERNADNRHSQLTDSLLPTLEPVLTASHNSLRTTGRQRLWMKDHNAAVFRNKKILIIESPALQVDSVSIFKADYVIVSGRFRFQADWFLQHISAGLIVFDSSVPLWKAEKWALDCEKAGISSFSVAKNGAFILNLN